MNASKPLALALLAALLPLGAQASGTGPSANTEIKREIADARKEIHAEMAKARAELGNENLSLDASLHFGKHGKGKSVDRDSLPTAQITSKGDFLLDGKAVAIDARQRQQLLAYRGQVIELARIAERVSTHAKCPPRDAGGAFLAEGRFPPGGEPKAGGSTRAHALFFLLVKTG